MITKPTLFSRALGPSENQSNVVGRSFEGARRPLSVIGRRVFGRATSAVTVVAVLGMSLFVTGVQPALADPTVGPAATVVTTAGAIAAGNVPNGTCRATVVGTGGGGASSGVANTNGGVGAAGAKITATFDLLPGQVYSGAVGGGGTITAGGVSGATGAGGASGTVPVATNHRGGGGGGRTEFIVGGASLMIAGGGGGGGGSHQLPNVGNGGVAGIPATLGPVAPGSAGFAGQDAAGVTNTGGGGGAIAAGGAGGVNSAQAAANGAAGAGLGNGTGGNG